MKVQKNKSNKICIITGAAGFIGFYISKRLLDLRYSVVGVDNINDYYDVGLKNSRLKQLENYPNFTFFKADISEKDTINNIFKMYKPGTVIHLAAQAGVRYSIENPDTYINSNIIGFYNILEACRHYPVEHLIYASSSSVYGANKTVPF
jgi:UDP-glucuronate 4-epimerase